MVHPLLSLYGGSPSPHQRQKLRLGVIHIHGDVVHVVEGVGAEIVAHGVVDFLRAAHHAGFLVEPPAAGIGVGVEQVDDLTDGRRVGVRAYGAHVADHAGDAVEALAPGFDGRTLAVVKGDHEGVVVAVSILVAGGEGMSHRGQIGFQ